MEPKLGYQSVDGKTNPNRQAEELARFKMCQPAGGKKNPITGRVVAMPRIDARVRLCDSG
jgi:hypothetical protein